MVHDIVEEYKKSSGIAEEYLNVLKAQILNKGLIGKKTDKKTIDEVVNFLHSDEVAGMIKESLGARAGGLSNDEILARYGLPKHRIKELLDDYESITENALLQLVGTLSVQLHGELTSHHPAQLANLAYDQGVKAAQGVLNDLYKVSGGEKFAADNQKSIDNLLSPDKVHDHTAGLYRDRTLHNELHRHTEKSRKPVYK